MKPIGDLFHTHHVYMFYSLEVMIIDLLFDLHLRAKIALILTISFLKHISKTHGDIVFIMHTQISADVPFAGLLTYFLSTCTFLS